MIVSNLLNPGNKYIKTFDFKTLYTKIPHKLKENLKIFLSSVFSFKKKQYINIGYKSAQFSDKPNKYSSFNENNFINHISYLIDNCYISFDKGVKQQVIGIPMGTNCASHVANIFLHVYEKTFISQLIEEDNNEHMATLGTIFRYQDDLISFGEQSYY